MRKILFPLGMRCAGASLALLAGACAVSRSPAKTEGQKPAVENLVFVSWGDQIMLPDPTDARLDEPDKIQRSMRVWKEFYDASEVLWRASMYYVDEFYERRVTNRRIGDFYEKVSSIRGVFDPLSTAREAAHANGLSFLLYMTFLDHGAPTNLLYGGYLPFPWQDRATIERPEWQEVDLRGNLHYGVLDLARPESRKLMVDRLAGYARRFDADGLYVCTRTHSLPARHADQFGFSPPVVAEYLRRYGIDITEEERFDYLSPGYAPHDPAVERWRRLRGGYLVQFYRELRAALPGKTIYTGIPRGRYLGPPYGNLYLDWEALIEEKLVDGLVLGVRSGKGLHPPLYVPHEEIGYRSSEDDAIAIPSMRESIEALYGPLCYEHGVKLFVDCDSFAARHRQWALREPYLTGSKINLRHRGEASGQAEHDPAFEPSGGRMTVEAFVYVDRRPGKVARMLSKYDHFDDPQRRGWEWILQSDGHFQYRVRLNTGGGAEGAGQGDRELLSESSLPEGRWVHLATVFDRPSRRLRLYIDGRLDAEARIPDLPLLSTPEQRLHLGEYGGGPHHPFYGRMDELRITHRALSFNGPPKRPYTGAEEGVAALYRFDNIEDRYFVPNAAPGGPLPRIRLIGAEPLAESMEGFGRALHTTPFPLRP